MLLEQSYWLTRWISRLVVESFFREVTVVGMERVPATGPVIFVGNHNNQIIDASLMMAVIPRQLVFLIARKSTSRRVIGRLARMAGAVVVSRSEDMRYPGIGRILALEPVDTPASPNAVTFNSGSAHTTHGDAAFGTTLVTGDSLTRFTLEVKSKDKIKFDGSDESYAVASVIDDRHLMLEERLTPEEINQIFRRASGRPKGTNQTDQSDLSDRTEGGRSDAGEMSTFESAASASASGLASASTTTMTTATSTVKTPTPNSGRSESTGDSEAQLRYRGPIVGGTNVNLGTRPEGGRVEHREEGGERRGEDGEGREDRRGTEGERKCKGQVSFTVVPKVDQGEIYETVCQALYEEKCISIFPEGGSHDQPHLMPLKPGVAIMALNAALVGIEDTMIIPVGFHYYERHKFGSKAVVEIGEPLSVSAEEVEQYASGNKREAVNSVMNSVKEAMEDIMIAAPDYRTLKAIELCAALYPPEKMRLAPEKNHELMSLFSQLFKYYRHEEDIEVSAVKEAAKEAAKGAAKEAAKGAAQEAAKGAAKEAAKGAAKEAARESAEEASKGASKGASKEAFEEATENEIKTKDSQVKHGHMTDSQMIDSQMRDSQVMRNVYVGPTTKLVENLLAYGNQLEANGVKDHEVPSLKLSVDRALAAITYKIVVLVIVWLISLPGLIVATPVRHVCRMMADRHRIHYSAGNKLKVTGHDVVGTYKIVWTILFMPVCFSLLGLVIGIHYTNSPLGIILSVGAALAVLPHLSVYALRKQNELMPLLRQIRCLYRVLILELDTWRQGERQVIFDRIHLQLQVRDYVNDFLSRQPASFFSPAHPSSHNFKEAIHSREPVHSRDADDATTTTERDDRSEHSKDERGDLLAPASPTSISNRMRKVQELQAHFERVIPRLLILSDTRRLKQAKDNFLPLVYRSNLASREEIL